MAQCFTGSETLLPCPFCGCDGQKFKDFWDSGTIDCFGCKDCAISFECADEWNRREPQSVTVAQAPLSPCTQEELDAFEGLNPKSKQLFLMWVERALKAEAGGIAYAGSDPATAQAVRLRYAILGYLEVFDRCGGSESVSPDAFAAARQGLREAVAMTSTDRRSPRYPDAISPEPPENAQ